MKDIAKEKKVDVAQICISWGLQRAFAIGVLPKSGDNERIKRNFKTVDMSGEEMDRVNALVEDGREGKRFVDLVETFGFSVFGDGI